MKQPYKSNTTLSVFNAEAARYDRWYDRNRFAYESELAAVKELLPSKGTGLEIGVGTGRFAAPLGIQFGIDPSEKMLSYARARGIVVKQATGENIPFPDQTFDFVLIAIALCFVKNPKKVINEARRVLKRNERIIVAIIDKNSFLGKHYQTKKSIFYASARFFGVSELTELLRNAGFNRFRYRQTITTDPQTLSAAQKPLPRSGKGGFVVIQGTKMHATDRSEEHTSELQSH